MPKIQIEHNSNHNQEIAYEKIKTFFQGEDEMKKWDPNIKCQFSDSTMTGDAKGSQFSAKIAVTSHNSGSKVSILVDLPLLLTPFKGKIQESIEKKLKKYLS